ncbi:GntR family transcriptional regulator (plasmid) [Streptomyces sp. BI20]|uniref:GntR family transcriptional regulator n=1 Tax=Streptomyces sp. BI20 TaxID=3403460 RepID=UPI003C758AB7
MRLALKVVNKGLASNANWLMRGVEMRGYRDLADVLRQQITDGVYSPGAVLPRITDLMAEYELSRQTVREAIGVLSDEGLVVTKGRAGTVVRHRVRVRVPLSRYTRTLSTSPRGPWETACADQGLDGYMQVVGVHRTDADEETAELLEVPAGTPLVVRHRHAMLGREDVVQIQRASYPAVLADEVGLGDDTKRVGGALAAFAAAGHTPTTVSEHVLCRLPTSSEADELEISSKVTILAITRVTRAAERVVEVLTTTTPADRVELLYESLPL